MSALWMLAPPCLSNQLKMLITNYPQSDLLHRYGTRASKQCDCTIYLIITIQLRLGGLLALGFGIPLNDHEGLNFDGSYRSTVL